MISWCCAELSKFSEIVETRKDCNRIAVGQAEHFQDDKARESNSEAGSIRVKRDATTPTVHWRSDEQFQLLQMNCCWSVEFAVAKAIVLRQRRAS